MRQLRPKSTFITAIFEYPNPIDPKEFQGILEGEEWFRGRRSRRRPNSNNTSKYVVGDMTIDDDELYQIGVTERAGIYYANNFSLFDFGNCALLTIFDRRGLGIDSTIDEAKKTLDILSDIDMVDQLSVFEAYISANARVADEQDIDILLNDETLDRISEIHGENPRGQKLTLKSNAAHDSNKWYRISIDLTENMNPLLWGVDYQRRFEDFDDIDGEQITADIEETLEEILSTDNGDDSVESW